MHYYIEMREKYAHALDSMWTLFKYGWDREKGLEGLLSSCRDEFVRIQVISGEHTEIHGICDRAIMVIDKSACIDGV